MEKDIGKIKKDDQTDIVIRIDDFGGSPGVTIREFVSSERYTGFTKAGIRIISGDFQKFKEIMESIDVADFKIEKKIDKIIWDAVKGIKKPINEEMEIFNKWYKTEFA